MEAAVEKSKRAQNGSGASVEAAVENSKRAQNGSGASVEAAVEKSKRAQHGSGASVEAAVENSERARCQYTVPCPAFNHHTHTHSRIHCVSTAATVRVCVFVH
eukprot:COSAG01_NODE_8695_length_2694_cov_11.670906_3_plen_103_part_00